jgi:hypothetical protein
MTCEAEVGGDPRKGPFRVILARKFNLFFLNLYFHKYREINLTIMTDMSTDIRVFVG